MQIHKRLKNPFNVASKGRSDSIGIFDLWSQVMAEVGGDKAKIPMPRITGATLLPEVDCKLPPMSEMQSEYAKLREKGEVS